MKRKNKWIDISLTKKPQFPNWAEKRFNKKLNKMKNKYNRGLKMVFKGKRFTYKAEFRADKSSGSYWYYKKRRGK